MFNNEEVMHALERGTITLKEALSQLTGERASDGNGLAIGTVVAIRRPVAEGSSEYVTDIRSAGFRDWDNTMPVETTDTFRVYSATKPFTAAIIQQLQQEGALNLHDKLTDWIERIGSLHAEVSEEKKALEKLHIHPEATIEDVLLHRSGIGNYSQGPFIAAANSTPGRPWSVYDLFSYNVVETAGKGKNDAYGTFCYSDTGYNLLALIAEHATGKPYETQVQELCAKEGLYHTCFTPEAKAREAVGTAHLAHGYIPNPGKAGEPTSSMEYDTSLGAGGLLSTAEDMVLWAERAYVKNSAELTETHTVSVVGEVPSRCGDARYGRGIMEQYNDEGKSLYGHGGYARGGRSKVFYYPDSYTSVVTLESFETITSAIAKKLAEQHSAFKDVRKTILSLRDTYTDATGKFNRSLLVADWNQGKGMRIVMGRVSEIVRKEIREGTMRALALSSSAAPSGTAKGWAEKMTADRPFSSREV